MAMDAVPSEAQRQAFIGKLNEFRGGLTTSEQQMLDALVEAARQAHEQRDVEVYWFMGTGSGVLNPGILGSYGPYSGTATYSGMQEGPV